MDFSQKNHVLNLNTPLGKDYLILTVAEGNEGISQLFKFNLQVFSQDKDIDPSKVLGKSISFQIQNHEGVGREFNGMVSGFTKGSLNFNQTRNYSIETVPWLWFLTLTSNCQIFQNKTTPQIIEAVFKDLGFSDFDLSKLTKNYIPREYCVQYDESAFHFVSRLMEEEGIFYYFQHESEKHILVLGDNKSSFFTLPGQSLHTSDSTFPRAYVLSWQQEYTFCSGKYSHNDYNFETPNKNLLTTTTTILNDSDFKKYELYDYPGFYTETNIGKDKSKIRMEEKETGYERVKAESNYCHLASGGIFSIKDKETSTNEKKYVISSLYHKAIDKTHVARDDEIPSYQNSFICFPRDVNFHPNRITKKPTIPGPQTAIVVGPEKEEIYTDKYGRIKVQFYWDRKGTKDDKSSCWMRVSQSIAGNHWGAIYIPRIGQEVIVTFLNGDIDSPLITGCVYNASQMPPYELPKNQTKMGIKTHSTKEGTETEANELMFEDKKGSEEIYLHGQKDYKEVIENDASSKIGHDCTIEVTNNLKTTVKEGNQEETVEKGNRLITVQKGNHEIEVNAGNYSLVISQGNQSTKVSLGKSSLEAMQAIELIVGQNSVKIDQTGITLQGMMIKINGTMVQVDANAMLELKGAITMIN